MPIAPSAVRPLPVRPSVVRPPFVRPQNLVCCLAAFLCLGSGAGPAATAGESRATTTVFQFNDPAAATRWQVVNDGVMGGRSFGQRRVNEYKNLEFSGTLSLANNGGFSSIRTRKSGLSLSDDSVIIVRVRGDGREYKFNLYTQQNLSGYSWRQSFQTRKGEWVDVEIPLNKFVATWRGRTFRNERLNPSQVEGMGILLGDKKPGPFKLEIESIKVRR